jgi:SAM-dependent methyltransferase
MYYQDKIESLKDIFGVADIAVEDDHIRVASRRYPVVDDVIVLADPSQYSNLLKQRLGNQTGAAARPQAFAEDIQYTFGEEWKTYNAMLPEHQKEFREYFDIVDLASLNEARVCDLGCGMGRWSFFARNHCREIMLVDFSDAIFMARKNMIDAKNALFFMCDLKRLPFRDSFADFLFCLGVLHHLPTDCLKEVRALRKAAPRLLIFLYYALDNRPWYFPLLLKTVTAVRLALSAIRSPSLRTAISWLGTWLIYIPLIWLGKVMQIFGKGRYVPLYEYYHDKSVGRIEQDVYDRFFTRIEQRVTRNQVLGLRDSFSRITVSDHFPYWHFLCER